MTAAPEIPADVMAAALECWGSLPKESAGIPHIARAILAERERAAEVCRNLAPATQDMTSTFIGDALFDAAAAIEAGASA